MKYNLLIAFILIGSIALAEDLPNGASTSPERKPRESYYSSPFGSQGPSSHDSVPSNPSRNEYQEQPSRPQNVNNDFPVKVKEALITLSKAVTEYPVNSVEGNRLSEAIKATQKSNYYNEFLAAYNKKNLSPQK